jgi:hypothetical protein
MKTAAVIIDSWKLTIFKKHLDGANYIYTHHAGPGRDIITLQVKYDWAANLKPIVEAANTECAKTKQPTN